MPAKKVWKKYDLIDYSRMLQQTKKDDADLVLKNLMAEHSVLKSMMQHSPVFFFLLSYVTMEIIYYTPGILGQLLRMPEKEIDENLKAKGMAYVFSLIHPADVKLLTVDSFEFSQEVAGAFPIEMRDKVRYTNNYRIRRGDGTWAKFMGQFCVACDRQEGFPLFAFGTISDITEQKIDNKILFKAEFFDELNGHKSIIREFIPEDTESLALSKRELEVALLLAKGRNNKEIAGTVFLSEFTVKAHRRNIFEKTGVNKVAELVAVLAKNGLL
ncbi:MAG: response regulator transcription factor [Cytophagales bacterium]